MPYVKKEARKELDAFDRRPENCGELNYMITMAIIEQLKADKLDLLWLRGRVHASVYKYWHRDKQNYQAINDIIGAGTGAVREMWRRVGDTDDADLLDGLLYIDEVITEVLDKFYEVTAGPYEDEKVKENGDVYSF